MLFQPKLDHWTVLKVYLETPSSVQCVLCFDVVSQLVALSQSSGVSYSRNHMSFTRVSVKVRGSARLRVREHQMCDSSL